MRAIKYLWNLCVEMVVPDSAEERREKSETDMAKDDRKVLGNFEIALN